MFSSLHFVARPRNKSSLLQFPLKGGKRPRERQLSWWVVGGSPSFPGSNSAAGLNRELQGPDQPCLQWEEPRGQGGGTASPTDPGELLGKQQFAASRQKDKTCSLEDSYAILLPKRTHKSGEASVLKFWREWPTFYRVIVPTSPQT